MLKINSWILVSLIISFPQISFGTVLPDMTGCHIPTSDYGILTNQEKIPNKKLGWQCFPVEEVVLTLYDWAKDKETYRDVRNPKMRNGNLTITGFTNGKNLRQECQGRNEYSLPEELSPQKAEKVFHHIQEIMKDKKYVCIAGQHTSKEILFNGAQPLDNWVFVKIRARNRCYSYFSDPSCS